MLNVKRFQSFKICCYPFLVENILHSNLLKDVFVQAKFAFLRGYSTTLSSSSPNFVTQIFLKL